MLLLVAYNVTAGLQRVNTQCSTPCVNQFTLTGVPYCQRSDDHVDGGGNDDGDIMMG